LKNIYTECFSVSLQVGAEVVIGEPFKGCTSFVNEESIKHRIVVVERGECMFIDKVNNALIRQQY